LFGLRLFGLRLAGLRLAGLWLSCLKLPGLRLLGLKPTGLKPTGRKPTGRGLAGLKPSGLMPTGWGLASLGLAITAERAKASIHVLQRPRRLLLLALERQSQATGPLHGCHSSGVKPLAPMHGPEQLDPCAPSGPAPLGPSVGTRATGPVPLDPSASSALDPRPRAGRRGARPEHGQPPQRSGALSSATMGPVVEQARRGGSQ
jgi:hypothetical protein